MDNVKLYAIVVAYKGRQWYDRCFTSLRQSTMPIQTIVVDNASNDGSVEYIKEHFPEIHLIESKENLGFGKGNNLALRYAYEQGCDYVFLLNQDAWVEPDTFEKLVALSHRHPEFGIIAPVHLSADKQSLGMMMEYQSNHYMYGILSDLYCGTVKEIYETNYVNAAGWLLPRNTLSTLGGFDPLIFHYGEDDDYVNRARYHGLKIGICLDARMVHAGFSDEWSKKLSRQAHIDDLELYLDLNRPFDYHSLRRYYLRKCFMAMLSRNRELMNYSKYKFKYLKRMRHAIEYSRKTNCIKQPNWIQ